MTPLAAQEPPTGPARHVVLISVDGLPAYLLNDPNVPLTHIRGLAAHGASAVGMIPSNPSVTWPNHTTLVTGVDPADHGVLFNGVLERGGLGLPVKVNPRKDKAELVLVPTIYDVLHERGMSTAGINWPCTRNSGTLQIDFPDVPESLSHTTPELLEELKAVGMTEALELFNQSSPIARDRVWTDAACHVIRTRRPAFLMLHLLNVDAVHHRYGPKTWAGNSAVAFADRCVGDVLQSLDEAGIREETAVIIISDHGFITIPKTIQPNVLLRQAGLLTTDATHQITAAQVMTVPEGGISMVYLTRPDTADRDRKKVIELFENQEGIAAVLTPEQFAEYGLPLPEDYPQMADLVLAAKDGYGFSGSAAGDHFIVDSTSTLGTHGFLSTNPLMQATFVAAGAGINSGQQLDVIENTRVAPTIARLLGVDFDSATGAPLLEIFNAAVSSGN